MCDVRGPHSALPGTQPLGARHGAGCQCIVPLISTAALHGLPSCGAGEKAFARGCTGKRAVGVQTCSAAAARALPLGCVEEHQGSVGTSARVRAGATVRGGPQCLSSGERAELAEGSALRAWQLSPVCHLPCTCSSAAVLPPPTGPPPRPPAQLSAVLQVQLRIVPSPLVGAAAPRVQCPGRTRHSIARWRAALTSWPLDTGPKP